MSKYTPGPYEARIDRERHAWSISAPSWENLAYVYYEDEKEVEGAANADLFVSAPEQQALIDRLEAEKAELLEACKFFVTSLETGLIIRDVSRDGESDWAYKMMDFVRQLRITLNRSNKMPRDRPNIVNRKRINRDRLEFINDVRAKRNLTGICSVCGGPCHKNTIWCTKCWELEKIKKRSNQ